MMDQLLSEAGIASGRFAMGISCLVDTSDKTGLGYVGQRSCIAAALLVSDAPAALLGFMDLGVVLTDMSRPQFWGVCVH